MASTMAAPTGASTLVASDPTTMPVLAGPPTVQYAVPMPQAANPTVTYATPPPLMYSAPVPLTYGAPIYHVQPAAEGLEAQGESLSPPEEVQPMYSAENGFQSVYQAQPLYATQMVYQAEEDGAQYQQFYPVPSLPSVPYYQQPPVYYENMETEGGDVVAGYAPVQTAFLPSMPSMVAYQPNTKVYASAEEARAAALNSLPPSLARAKVDEAATAQVVEAEPEKTTPAEAAPNVETPPKEKKKKKSKKVTAKKKACC